MSPLITLVDMAIEVYTWLLLARIIMSWLPSIDRYHPVVKFIYSITEPVLRPFRNLIPPVNGIDLSPIVVFFVLGLVRRLVMRLLIVLL